jgi:hypothetical protein
LGFGGKFTVFQVDSETQSTFDDDRKFVGQNLFLQGEILTLKPQL